MTTLKGAIRSYGATVRRIEREQQRQAREAAKQFKEQQKLQEIEDAQQAVFNWSNYVETIQSLHKKCTTPIDWDQIRNSTEPIPPVLKSTHETRAKNRLLSFKPSFIDRIFGLKQKKINQLKHFLEKAIQKDTKHNKIKYDKYLQELNNWKELQAISIGIEKKQIASYKNALSYFEPFSDIGELGTQINCIFETDRIDINLHINSLDIIPTYELKQTSTGKLSKKNMAKSKFNELYQDHICSCILRIAREIFSYLPVEHVRINAMTELVNGRTGHLEKQPIVSVIIPKKTIETLNMDTLDPSDSMQNFVHAMKFSKIKGFNSVTKIKLTT